MRTRKSSLPSPESVLTPCGGSQMSRGLQDGNAGPGSRSQWELRLKGSQGNDGVSGVLCSYKYGDAEAAGRRRAGSGERARTRPWGLGTGQARDGEAEGQVPGRQVCTESCVGSFHVPSLRGWMEEGPGALGRDPGNHSPVRLLGSCYRTRGDGVANTDSASTAC